MDNRFFDGGRNMRFCANAPFDDDRTMRFGGKSVTVASDESQQRVQSRTRCNWRCSFEADRAARHAVVIAGAGDTEARPAAK